MSLYIYIYIYIYIRKGRIFLLRDVANDCWCRDWFLLFLIKLDGYSRMKYPLVCDTLSVYDNKGLFDTSE